MDDKSLKADIYLSIYSFTRILQLHKSLYFKDFIVIQRHSNQDLLRLTKSGNNIDT